MKTIDCTLDLASDCIVWLELVLEDTISRASLRTVLL